MASDTNGHAAANASAAATAHDFLAEAEELRDSLFETARRANRLVATLKQYKKDRRVLQTAWSSLKNLRLGS